MKAIGRRIWARKEAGAKSGGVNIAGVIGAVGGDIVGGNKGLDENQIVAALDAGGHLQAAKLAGLQEWVILDLARRLKSDVLDFEQAITELKRAVEVALDVIARGERGTNDDAFVNAVLAQVAEKVRSNDLDGGAGAIDEALAELEAQHRRSRVTLLEEG